MKKCENCGYELAEEFEIWAYPSETITNHCNLPLKTVHWCEKCCEQFNRQGGIMQRPFFSFVEGD